MNHLDNYSIMTFSVDLKNKCFQKPINIMNILPIVLKSNSQLIYNQQMPYCQLLDVVNVKQGIYSWQTMLVN